VTPSPAVLRRGEPFRLLFSGQALSVVGDRITPIALAFAALEIGTATDVGLIFAAGTIPYALFALVGGVLADRVGRREVMLAADILRTVVQAILAALLLTGTAEIWMMVVLSALYGVGAAAFFPALNGLISQTVRPQHLQEANALLALTRSVANVTGPALAGLIVALIGTGEAVALDALTFAVSAVCLFLLPATPVADPAHAQPAGMIAQLRAGWREVVTRTWLWRGLLAISAYHVFVLPAVFVLGPALANRQLDGASSWATIVAAFGVGSVVGNVIALRAPVRRPILVAACALVIGSTQALIIGSGFGTFGIAALETVAGVAVALFFTFWDMSLQEQVPPGAVARVSSYDFTVSLGLMPLGLALAGPVSDALGLEETLRLMSAVSILVALGWLAAPSVRQLRRPSAAPPPPAPEAAVQVEAPLSAPSGGSGRAR
jgi:predicted MFS family arabinose efflux permease